MFAAESGVSAAAAAAAAAAAGEFFGSSGEEKEERFECCCCHKCKGAFSLQCATTSQNYFTIYKTMMNKKKIVVALDLLFGCGGCGRQEVPVRQRNFITCCLVADADDKDQ